MPDPLAVLLLPQRLEEFELAEHARDLLRAPLVVALEPPRVPWRRLARLPEAFALRTSLRSAKRLKLPGEVRVVILYDPLQTFMALGLLARHPNAELWYLRPEREDAEAEARVEREDAEAGARLARRSTELDGLARRRADLEMTIADLAPLPPERTWFEANEPLWNRLEELQIAHFKG